MFPHTLRTGIVTLDPTTGAAQRVIALQYNPETLNRSLAVQAAGTDPAQALRLKGVAVETIRLEAAIDATDDLVEPQLHPERVQVGIHPEIAALQALVNPRTAVLVANQGRMQSGLFDALPEEEPLALFVWSKERVVPVRINELAVVEELFDTKLNPIRAKVTLTMRVLSVDDFGLSTRGGTLHLAYLQNQERRAAQARSASLSLLGLGGI